MKKFRFFTVLAVAICLVAALFTGCEKKTLKNPMIAVFIPGIIADSPTYEKLANGVLNGVGFDPPTPVIVTLPMVIDAP